MTTIVTEFSAFVCECPTFRAEHVTYKSTHFAKCELYLVSICSASDVNIGIQQIHITQHKRQTMVQACASKPD